MTQPAKTQLTIQEALREIKLTESKLHRNAAVNVIAIRTPDSTVVGGYANEADFIAASKAALQSTKDLLHRYHLLKQRVAESNAVTTVMVAGKTMSVVAAIEYKNSISMEKLLLSRMQREYAAVIQKKAATQVQIQRDAERAADAFFAGEAKVRDSKDYTEFTQKYLAKHEVVEVDPNNILAYIDELSKFIEDFEADIDNVLTLSNVQTTITL